MTDQLYCAVYRQGGRFRFRWTHTLACSAVTADAQVESLKRAGYHAHVAHYNAVMTNGLPETFGPADLPQFVVRLADGWSAMQPPPTSGPSTMDLLRQQYGYTDLKDMGLVD